jgi:hypothetical protein
MTEKLKLSDIDFQIHKFSADNDALAQYFQLRYDVYNSFNMPYYAKPTSTRWDRHPDTRFLLLVNKKTSETIGGRRFIIHQPNSKTGIYSEENTGFTIEEMLPHLPANSMRYAELGSLCFSPAIRGIGAAEKMYKKTFEYMRKKEVDFIVSNPITANYERLKNAALANGVQQFICRNDLLSVEDGDDEPTVFFSFKTASELNLQSPSKAEKFHNGVATNERQLLQKIFGTGFVNCADGRTLNKKFFDKILTLTDLNIAHDFLQERSANFDGIEIEAAHRINTKETDDQPAFMLLVQLHGNEPAGLAAFLYTLALSQCGQLRQPVIAVIGNDTAAEQYFNHYSKHPKSPQTSRDIFRRGIDDSGNALADMNRLPVNFLELKTTKKKPYIKRWQELNFIADNVTGILDIHSARGNMVCVTDSSDNNQLAGANIRNILHGLTQAIGAATDSETFKTVAGKKLNIKHQFGIEAGMHEDKNSFRIAAEFVASLFTNLVISSAGASAKNSSDIFYEYIVQPKICFANLTASAIIQADDSFVTVKKIDGKLQEYQYEEFEQISKGQVVALSKTSATTLSAPADFAVLFITKSAQVFSDTAIGLYPVAGDKMETKFCYPCKVKQIKITSKND